MNKVSEFTVSEQHLRLLKSSGGTILQGGVNLENPERLQMEYAHHALGPMLLRPSPNWPENALCIGLGAAEFARFMRANYPDCELHAVEISQEIIELAYAHFLCPPQGENFVIHNQCGAEFMAQCTQRFDYILIDGFSASGKAGPLESLEFYQKCREALTLDGFLAVNLLPEHQNVTEQIEKLTVCFGYKPQLLACKTITNVVALLHRVEGRPGFSPKQLIETSRTLSEKTGMNFGHTTNALFKSLMNLDQSAPAKPSI